MLGWLACWVTASTEARRLCSDNALLRCAEPACRNANNLQLPRKLESAVLLPLSR